MKQDKTILMVMVIAAAMTMILSVPDFGMAPKNTISSVTDGRGYLVKIGDEVLDNFELVLHDGRKTSLKQLRGRVVVLQLQHLTKHLFNNQYYML